MEREVYNRIVPIRFGDFVVDLDRRELRDRSGPIHLTPKAFELLQLLIASRPKVVSRTALYDALWPDTYVQPTNLHNLIREIRNALHDRGRKIIRTKFGFGFSFAGDAFVDEAASLTPRIFLADRSFDLHEGENIVGRQPAATVQIQSASVSRVHARITVTADAITIEDLGSKNGTFVHGSRLRAAAPLADGDEVTFGRVHGVLRLVETPRTETAR